ncbi:MAG TPA: hypothetical protein VGZ73_27795 [Bryobacteraceae bacterium]|jgi:hypothetical protein|nr:hypothetical protein [Bryobacteraceae bacterium]
MLSAVAASPMGDMSMWGSQAEVLMQRPPCGMLTLAMSVRLQFEGIRCFSEPQDAVVSPLTLLVGENSSGKSTFLALCQIASSITNGYAQEFPFNQPPFLLGAYDQIASYRGGRAGRAKSFSIGVSVDDGAGGGSIRAEFVSKNGQPSLRGWQMVAGSSIWQVTVNDSAERASLVVSSSPKCISILGHNRNWGVSSHIRLAKRGALSSRLTATT